MSAIGRRIRWFMHGFGHVGPLVRPRYRKRSTDTQRRRLAEQVAREKLIAQRKGARKR